jgi:hypothetical protein
LSVCLCTYLQTGNKQKNSNQFHDKQRFGEKPAAFAQRFSMSRQIHTFTIKGEK